MKNVKYLDKFLKMVQEEPERVMDRCQLHMTECVKCRKRWIEAIGDIAIHGEYGIEI